MNFDYLLSLFLLYYVLEFESIDFVIYVTANRHTYVVNMQRFI